MYCPFPRTSLSVVHNVIVLIHMLWYICHAVVELAPPVVVFILPIHGVVVLFLRSRPLSCRVVVLVHHVVFLILFLEFALPFVVLIHNCCSPRTWRCRTHQLCCSPILSCC
jgi:hypothetical protein